MRRAVRFLFGEEWREVEGLEPTTTVLDWLRLDQRLTGTKEGCAEGDCGACTILVGRVREQFVRYAPVDSCILPLASLDGTHVLTIEHIRDARGGLHPVQQAMVDAHATQCGFCTPGFVMALWPLWHLERPLDDAAIEEALQGNLCRCTGYAPIVEAARRMMVDNPQEQRRATSMARRAHGALVTGVPAHDTLAFGRDDRIFYAPTHDDEMLCLLAEHPDATLVAGATDFGVAVTKQMKRPKTLIGLFRLIRLGEVADKPGFVSLGARVTWTEARPTLARYFPGMDELIGRVGGPQIRAMGTIAGNIANGSPIGDSPPPLIALGARLTLRSAQGERGLPLEDYFLGYGKQDRRPGEFIAEVTIPKLGPRDVFRVWKISKRRDEDISSVCAAFNLTRGEDDVIAAARIAFGGMAATPKRARAAEAALVGRPWSRETFAAAAAALERDFAPLDDWRASAAYRMRVAQNLFERFWLDTSGQESRLLAPAQRVAHG